MIFRENLTFAYYLRSTHNKLIYTPYGLRVSTYGDSAPPPLIRNKSSNSKVVEYYSTQ